MPITSMDEAQSVARLIKDGKISGTGRDTAMKDLRDFDTSVNKEQSASGKPAVESMGTGEKLARGFAAGASGIGRGIEQLGVDAASAVGIKGADALSDKLKHQTDVSNQNNAGVLKTGAGAVGNFLGQTAATGPAALIPGAGTALGATAVGAAMGAAQPVGENDSRLYNAAVGGAGGLVGQKVGQAAAYGAEKLGDMLAGPVANGAAVAREGIKPAASKALGQGYVLPPSMAKAKPSIMDNMLEGLGGKIRMEQASSIPNQANVNSRLRQAWGLSPGDQVHMKDVLDLRKDAGSVYQEVRGLRGYLGMTPDYTKKLNQIDFTFQNYSERFPKIFKNDKVGAMLADIRKPMTPDEAVQLSIKLREDATVNYRAPKATLKALGKAQKKAADAIDGLLEEHLQNANFVRNNPQAPNLYPAYRKAREIIAQTYDVEKVLNDHTGNIDAIALAKLSKKRPLSGELKDIAEFGAHFEGAARTPTARGSRLGPKVSKTEIAAAGIAAAAGHPGAGHRLATAALYTGTPWLAKGYLLSDMYQKGMAPATASAIPETTEIAKRFGTIMGPYMLKDEQKQ